MVLVHAVLTLVAACSSKSSHSSTVVRLPTTINGVRLDPPPSGVKPALSQREARVTLDAIGDLKGASRIDSVLALVTSTTTDHVLAWVFIGHDVPFVGKGGGAPATATVVEPIGVNERGPLFSVTQSG